MKPCVRLDGPSVFHRNETREHLPHALRGGVIAIGNFDREACSVSFFGRLADELKSGALELHAVQMKKVCTDARALLADARPLSEIDREVVFQPWW